MSMVAHGAVAHAAVAYAAVAHAFVSMPGSGDCRHNAIIACIVGKG